MTESHFYIDHEYLGNPDAIAERVSRLPEADRQATDLVLRYLYLDNGPRSIPREARPIAKKHLSDTEHVIFPWLFKRTDAKLRRLYGPNVLDAVKKSRYQCAQCGFGDVRALHIEKTDYDEETKTQHFVCLCANCNTISAREKEMASVAIDKERAEEAAAKRAKDKAAT